MVKKSSSKLPKRKGEYTYRGKTVPELQTISLESSLSSCLRGNEGASNADIRKGRKKSCTISRMGKRSRLTTET